MSQGISKASTHPRSASRATRLHQALAAALLIGVMPLAANAATIAATSPDDNDPTAITTCTLRQAIVSMNAGMLQGNCTNAVPGDAFGTNDTITFAPSIVTGATIPGTVTLADSADNTGTIGGTLVITAGHLTIDADAWRGSGTGQYPGGITITRPATAANDFGIVRDSAFAGSSLTLNGLTLSQGKVTAYNCYGHTRGGGVCIERTVSLSLTRSTVSGNSAIGRSSDGGGIGSGTGAVTLTDSTVSGNSATYYGGGIYSKFSTLTLSDSTVSGNSAGLGGGIFGFHSTLTLTNSTVSGNSAGKGGGIYVDHGLATLTHVTVANNIAQGFGGGIGGSGGLYGDSIGVITNSIVSGNTQTTGSDIQLSLGGFQRNNLISVSASSLNLGPLQDNGGPTQTMLPGAGSAAIDYVWACSLATDQRGVTRPQGILCDIGAVEVRQGSATLSVTVIGNGAVSGRGINGCSSSGGTCSATYAYDETVPLVSAPLTLTPARGWLVTSVTPTPATCGGSLSADGLTYTTTALMQDCAVTVQFAENDEIFKNGFEGQ